MAKSQPPNASIIADHMEEQRCDCKRRDQEWLGPGVLPCSQGDRSLCRWTAAMEGRDKPSECFPGKAVIKEPHLGLRSRAVEILLDRKIMTLVVSLSKVFPL
jgi:hypothetical protein